MIFSKTFEEHLARVRDILQRLRMAGLTANNKKCSTATNSMNCSSGLQHRPPPTPQNNKEVARMIWNIGEMLFQLADHMCDNDYE